MDASTRSVSRGPPELDVMSRRSRHGLFLAAVLVMMTLLAGCASTNSENTGPTGTGVNTTTTPTPSGSSPPPATGCDGQRSCVRLTTLIAERKDCASQYSCADSGNEYLVTRVRVENTGTSDVDTNPFYFKVHDGGVSYPTDGATYSADNSLQLVTLSKGASKEGVLVFKVPKGGGSEVCFEPLVFTVSSQPKYCAPLAS
jgi:hypothetical protein